MPTSTPTMTGERPKVLVQGAGLGGLASAAWLAQRGGVDVSVVERLGFPGGRFSSHDHDGHAVPTGAVHMVPHGNKGEMGRVMLGSTRKDGLDLTRRQGVRFNRTTQLMGRTTSQHGHEAIPNRLAALRMFGMGQGVRMARHLVTGAGREPAPEDEEVDGRTWFEQRFDRELVDFMDAFSNFAVSLRFEQMPASTVVKMMQRSFWKADPAIPTGGAKGLTDGLVRELKGHGVRPKVNHEVSQILPGDAEEATKGHRFAVEVRRRGREDAEWRGVDAIIANGGHRNVLDALSDDFQIEDGLRAQVEETRPVGGIGFVYSVDGDIPQQHSGATMTPEAERVGGYVIPTFTEPSLAPEGRHLLISHQYVPSSDIQSEIGKGRDELHEQVPWLDDHGEELCVHAYHRNWPCNRSPQGSELPSDIGVEGLRLIGDGIKAHGWMMTEGIAHHVPRVGRSTRAAVGLAPTAPVAAAPPTRASR